MRGGLTWLATTRTTRHAAPAVEPIWFEWLALAGMFVFAAWLLGLQGVWALLFTSDPTGITLVIVVVFTLATLWSGARSLELARQRAALDAATAGGAASLCAAGSWAESYWAALRAAPQDANAPLDILLERTHGPHTTAWWVNAIQLKLGLLGKVIGFSILALHIGQMQGFDAAQSQDLLKSLTSGLGVALLTTMVGLIGNILLGLQLTRLDRYADELVTQAQRHGVSLATARQRE